MRHDPTFRFLQGDDVPYSQSLPRFFGVRVTFALDALLYGAEVEVVD
jgi:hypothetical protein